MADPSRVEPPAGLAGQDGWHWLRENDKDPVPVFWRGGPKSWVHYAWSRQMYALGWRYVAPVASSEEVATLRSEPPLAVGDWIASDVPRHAHRPAFRVDKIEFSYRISGPMLCAFFLDGRRVRRIRVSSIHIDGKPRRSGWSRVG